MIEITLIKNLTGQRFGRLIALRLLPERTKDGKAKWECACDCGNIVTTISGDLVFGGTTSCGCSRMRDIAGQRFGRLVAIEPIDKRLEHGIVWRCVCDCGNTMTIRGAALVSGNTRSCGCIKHEMDIAIGTASRKWNPDTGKESRITDRRVPLYEDWRRAVYERDYWTCQKCGEHSDNLNAHHIEAYADSPELRIELSNGITLCKGCHRDFHHIYGLKATRAKLEQWLSKDVGE